MAENHVTYPRSPYTRIGLHSHSRTQLRLTHSLYMSCYNNVTSSAISVHRSQSKLHSFRPVGCSVLSPERSKQHTCGALSCAATAQRASTALTARVTKSPASPMVDADPRSIPPKQPTNSSTCLLVVHAFSSTSWHKPSLFTHTSAPGGKPAVSAYCVVYLAHTWGLG